MINILLIMTLMHVYQDDQMRLTIKTFKFDIIDEYGMMIIMVMMVGGVLFSNLATSKLIKSSFMFVVGGLKTVSIYIYDVIRCEHDNIEDHATD